MEQSSTPMSPGEMKAIQRESHLCFACAHAPVCKIATAIDIELLVIIQQCLAFESAATADGEVEP